MGETDGRRTACTGQLSHRQRRNDDPESDGLHGDVGNAADRSAGPSTSKNRLDQVAEENKLVKAITVYWLPRRCREVVTARSWYERAI